MTPSKYIGLALISLVLTILVLWNNSKQLEGKGCGVTLFTGIVLFAIIFALGTLLAIGVLFLMRG